MEHLFAEYYKAIIYAIAAFAALYIFIHQTYGSEDMRNIVDTHYSESSMYYSAEAKNKDISVYLQGYAAKGDIVTIHFEEQSIDYKFLALDCNGTFATLMLIDVSGDGPNIDTEQFAYSPASVGKYDGSVLESKISSFGEDLRATFGGAVQEVKFREKIVETSIADQSEVYNIYDNQYFVKEDSSNVISKYARSLCLKDIKQFVYNNDVTNTNLHKILFENTEKNRYWLMETFGSDAFALTRDLGTNVIDNNNPNAWAVALPVVIIDLSQIEKFDIQH